MFPTGRLIHPFAVAIALGLALLVTGIPLAHVTHSHVHDTHGCPAHEGHADAHGNAHGRGEGCWLCVYFAHFVPTASPAALGFSFLDQGYALEGSFHIPEAHRLAEGNRPGQANKGPPKAWPT